MPYFYQLSKMMKGCWTRYRNCAAFTFCLNSFLGRKMEYQIIFRIFILRGIWHTISSDMVNSFSTSIAQNEVCVCVFAYICVVLISISTESINWDMVIQISNLLPITYIKQMLYLPPGTSHETRSKPLLAFQFFFVFFVNTHVVYDRDITARIVSSVQFHVNSMIFSSMEINVQFRLKCVPANTNGYKSNFNVNRFLSKSEWIEK